LGHGVDFLVLLGFLFVQARITALLLRACARRWEGARLLAARAAIVLFDVLLLAGYLLSFSEILSWVRLPTHIGAYIAAAAMVYLLVAAPAVIIRAIRNVLWRRSRPTDRTRRLVLRTAANAAIAAPAVVLGYGTFVERTDLRVREVDIPLAGLPPDLDGLRILQISDIHRGAFLSDRELGKVVDAALGLHPHLAVITGDLISTWGDPLDSCLAQLRRLKADAGILACMGNHERFAEAENHAERAGARAGIRFLRSTSQSLRFGAATLNVAGVDYQAKSEWKRYLRGAERLIVPHACNVLLSHNPDVFPVAARQGYNLLLAGHTHGGQVQVEIFDAAINPARFFTPYVYGVYRAGAAAAYVTRGVGTIGLPTRVGAPPEISLVRLGKA
jgi:uncharacterized protein